MESDGAELGRAGRKGQGQVRQRDHSPGQEAGRTLGLGRVEGEQAALRLGDVPGELAARAGVDRPGRRGERRRHRRRGGETGRAQPAAKGRGRAHAFGLLQEIGPAAGPAVAHAVVRFGLGEFQEAFGGGGIGLLAEEEPGGDRHQPCRHRVAGQVEKARHLLGVVIGLVVGISEHTDGIPILQVGEGGHQQWPFDGLAVGEHLVELGHGKGLAPDGRHGQVEQSFKGVVDPGLVVDEPAGVRPVRHVGPVGVVPVVMVVHKVEGRHCAHVGQAVNVTGGAGVQRPGAKLALDSLSHRGKVSGLGLVVELERVVHALRGEGVQLVAAEAGHEVCLQALAGQKATGVVRLEADVVEPECAHRLPHVETHAAIRVILRGFEHGLVVIPGGAQRRRAPQPQPVPWVVGLHHVELDLPWHVGAGIKGDLVLLPGGDDQPRLPELDVPVGAVYLRDRHLKRLCARGGLGRVQAPGRCGIVQSLSDPSGQPGLKTAVGEHLGFANRIGRRPGGPQCIGTAIAIL